MGSGSVLSSNTLPGSTIQTGNVNFGLCCKDKTWLRSIFRVRTVVKVGPSVGPVVWPGWRFFVTSVDALLFGVPHKGHWGASQPPQCPNVPRHFTIYIFYTVVCNPNVGPIPVDLIV